MESNSDVILNRDARKLFNNVSTEIMTRVIQKYQKYQKCQKLYEHTSNWSTDKIIYYFVWIHSINHTRESLYKFICDRIIELDVIVEINLLDRIDLMI